MTFSVALNIEVKKQGVQKAVFFIDSPIIMDFRTKSSRKSDTTASQCRSPFSRKWLLKFVTIKRMKKNIKTATTKWLPASGPSRRFTCILALSRRWAEDRAIHAFCIGIVHAGRDMAEHCRDPGVWGTVKKWTLLTRIHVSKSVKLSKYKIWYSYLLLITSVVWSHDYNDRKSAFILNRPQTSTFTLFGFHLNIHIAVLQHSDVPHRGKTRVCCTFKQKRP